MKDLTKIKLLVIDVDGTLTDGRLYFSSDGSQMKAFDAKDGCGIQIVLPKIGVMPAIITGGEMACVLKRANQLGIDEIYTDVLDKLSCLTKLRKKLSLDYSEIACIGDDLNDISIFEVCGVTACPCDSVKEITEKSDYVLTKKGERGAVREFIEIIKAAKMKVNQTEQEEESL